MEITKLRNLESLNGIDDIVRFSHHQYSKLQLRLSNAMYYLLERS